MIQSRRSLMFAVVLVAACATPPVPTPTASVAPAPLPAAPGAEKKDMPDLHLETIHGVTVADPHRWLEDVKAPKVQAWMTKQDEATRAKLAAFPMRAALAARFKALYYVDSVSAPRKRGERFFFARTHADKEKSIAYWKQGEKGAEQVLLDPNRWSEDGTVSLGTWVPSWDGKKVVYAQKANAADESTLHVLDVDTGEVSAIDVIAGGKYASPAWTPDSKAFYYEWLPTDATIPVDERPGHTELRFHVLGTDSVNDPIVHPKTGDPSTFLGGQLSRDGRYLFVYIQRGWNENDVYIRDLTKDTEFRLLVAGKEATYGVEAWKDQLYIVTDEGASKRRVFKVAAADPVRAKWQEIVAEDKDATLEETSIIGGKLVLSYLRNAASEIRLAGLDGKKPRTLALPAIGSVHGVVGNQDEDDAYYAFSSFTTPTQVYRTSISKGGGGVWAKVELPIDASKMTVEQVFYPSKDGTRIPMFLVHRSDVTRSGANPTLLYGYGGFNVSMTPNFRASIFPWIEAGGVYAIANLRGGGEFGKAWHDAGKGANKQNVFDDFAGAAEYLVREKWTVPAKLGIYGGSNGGLLVGAAMTQRPELFGAVVCAVPLLDMVRYHLFGSGRTWIPEYGTAEKAEEFKTLHAYSPYHHVEQGRIYPPLLMMSADNDDRVDPMHARKFVAAIEASGSTSAVLLRIERHAGHGGADQVKQAIESSADLYAFLFATLGLEGPIATPK